MGERDRGLGLARPGHVLNDEEGRSVRKASCLREALQRARALNEREKATKSREGRGRRGREPRLDDRSARCGRGDFAPVPGEFVGWRYAHPRLREREPAPVGAEPVGEDGEPRQREGKGRDGIVGQRERLGGKKGEERFGNLRRCVLRFGTDLASGVRDSRDALATPFQRLAVMTDDGLQKRGAFSCNEVRSQSLDEF